MRSLPFAALLLAAVAAAPACRSAKEERVQEPPVADVQSRPLDYRVIWTRGGMLGYVRTVELSRPDEPAVPVHTVLDLDFVERGWCANDGQGERYDYPEKKIREAKRTVFDRVVLPSDTVENQIRRILRLPATTEIALRTATAADVQGK